MKKIFTNLLITTLLVAFCTGCMVNEVSAPTHQTIAIVTDETESHFTTPPTETTVDPSDSAFTEPDVTESTHDESETTTTSTEPEPSEVPATDPVHEHSYFVKSQKEASCTANGVTIYACSCGERYETATKARGYHSWSVWEICTAPTVSTEGKKARSCKDCGATDEKRIDKLPAIEPAPPDTTPYMMIAQRTVNNNGKISVRYYLETLDEDGDTLFFEAMNDSIRITKIAAGNNDDRSPLVAFTQQTVHQLTAVTLALLPRILQIDDEQGGGKLGIAVAELGAELEDAPSWTSADDIPELVKEHLYTTDAAISVLDSIELDFGAATSTAPEEADVSAFHQPIKLKGSLVCENLNNGWTPRFIENDGTSAKKASKTVTVGLAKQQFASFSAHRNWTPMEKMLIPSFPDDMPVMPEVMRIANRICQTVNDTNPVCNVMWRSDTGFGKSTGTRQLACILNVPHLVMTCHPGMEVQEFKSNFVPSTADGIELDMTSVTSPVTEETQADRPPFFAEAMAYVATLDNQQRDELFNARRFYCDVMVEDTEELAQTIIGSKQNISIDDLCWLYAEVRSATLREEPLRKKVKQLEATAEAAPATEDKSNKPEFVHVVSNYVKAMVNGYICEIQEASRIRDSGVLVGLNEFDRPGSVIPLMNGALARRHKDAICIITDNVGYNSCRPIDPSVLRRQGFIIDSVELTKEQLIDRVKRNTKCSDQSLLDLAYTHWHTVKEYCEQNSITEGSVSPMELERFVQALMYDGLDCLEIDLDDCIISKATSSVEDQKGIRTACQTAGTPY